MQTTFALAALAAVVYGQGVTETLTPSSGPPAGCASTVSGSFQITAVNSTVMKRDLAKRTCGADGSLTLDLANGVLTDSRSRIGSIVANYQFQFDGPPAQTGAIYTGGFSLCGNGSLALGGSAVWYECLSGDFYNLYDRSWAPQCEPILIVALPCSGASSAGVGQVSDGQPTGTAVATPVSQISDGQPQGASAIPITQISDGQPQGATAIPITQISDGQPQLPTPLISQISDGQPQVPTSTPAPISQLSDGQPKAASPTPAPSSTLVTAVISQISDGQIQAPNSTAPAPTASPSTITANGGSVFAVGTSFAATVAGLAIILLL